MSLGQIIGENIRIIREMKGYSQEYMAAMLDMSQSGYSKIEIGSSQISIPKLEKIASILEQNVDDFLKVRDGQINIFNNNHQAIANSLIENLHSENRDVYEKLIAQLRGEIEFLRNKWLND